MDGLATMTNLPRYETENTNVKLRKSSIDEEEDKQEDISYDQLQPADNLSERVEEHDISESSSMLRRRELPMYPNSSNKSGRRGMGTGLFSCCCGSAAGDPDEGQSRC